MNTGKRQGSARSAAGSSAPHRRWPWKRALAGVVVVLVLVALATHRIDLARVHQIASRLNGGVAFALLVVLPLLGFPASVLHVAAGMRFGLALGLPLVSLSILIQLFASYAIVHRWRGWFARKFAGLRQKVPPSAHASVAVLAVLIPGAPFFAVNYVVPLIGVRLRTFVLCCWPLHTLRSTVTVLLGDQSDKFTPQRLAVLGGYALVLALASGWTYRRLRRQLGDPPAAAGDQTQYA